MTAARRSRPPVRNRIGWRQRLARLGGSSVDLDLRGFDAPLAAVREIERDLAELSDDAIAERARKLAARARGGAEPDGLRNETFALVCEAAARTLGSGRSTCRWWRRSPSRGGASSSCRPAKARRWPPCCPRSCTGWAARACTC